MGIILVEGFESGDFGAYTPSADALVQTGLGLIIGTYRIILGNSGASDNILYVLPSALNTVYVKFVAQRDLTTGLARIVLFENSGGTVLVEIKIDNATARLKAYVGAALVATGTTVVPNGSVNVRFEAMVFIDQTSGRIRTKIDGQLDIDFTGDTDPTAGSTVAQIRHMPNDSLGPSAYYIGYDSIIVRDDTWPGITEEYAAVPNGIGTYTSIPNAVYQGGDTVHWQTVDEVMPHNTTPAGIQTQRSLDYVWGVDADVGTKDSFALSDVSIPAGWMIASAQVEFSARASAAGGAPAVASFLRTGGADFEGAAQALTTSWKPYKQFYENNPQSGAGWSQAEINAAEVGVVIRGTGAVERQISCVRLVYEIVPVVSAIQNFAYFQLAVKVLACTGSIQWLIASMR